MVRSELVQTIARKNPHLSLGEIERIVTTIFDAMIEQLASGGRVELRGFGTFLTRARLGRTGRNPRTGDQVEVAAKRVPYFRPSRASHVRLNK
jgi:integration host factor subunit beta